MLKEIVDPRIEIINGEVEADGSSIDSFIRLNYEIEAEACLNEFMQILSHCEVMVRKYDSNTANFLKEMAIKKNREEREQLYNLVSSMENATNQQQLDDKYKKIMTKLDNYNIRLDVKDRSNFEEYIEREKKSAERSDMENNYDELYFTSGQYIRNVENSFLSVGGSSEQRRNIMKEYIETAYAHLTKKFAVRKSAETMLERYNRGLVQEGKTENLFDEETFKQPHSSSPKTSDQHVKGSSTEELSGIEEELERFREYYKIVEGSINKNRSYLNSCKDRLEKIEKHIEKGERRITDDDIESWEWSFPSTTDKSRIDKQGNPIELINISTAKSKVESIISKLEDEIKRLEGVLEGHQERIDILTSERNSLIKDDEDSTIEETGIFGIDKLRRAINRLMGVEDKLDSTSKGSKK